MCRLQNLSRDMVIQNVGTRVQNEMFYTRHADCNHTSLKPACNWTDRWALLTAIKKLDIAGAAREAGHSFHLVTHMPVPWSLMGYVQQLCFCLQGHGLSSAEHFWQLRAQNALELNEVSSPSSSTWLCQSSFKSYGCWSRRLAATAHAGHQEWRTPACNSGNCCLMMHSAMWFRVPCLPCLDQVQISWVAQLVSKFQGNCTCVLLSSRIQLLVCFVIGCGSQAGCWQWLCHWCW